MRSADDVLAAFAGHRDPVADAELSPDGSLSLPAFRVWQQGPIDHTGWRWSDGLSISTNHASQFESSSCHNRSRSRAS